MVPRKLCAQYVRFAMACWYRYWIEQAPGPVIVGARDLLTSDEGLEHELAPRERERGTLDMTERSRLRRQQRAD